jgi:biopolymer transport protein ExbB
MIRILFVAIFCLAASSALAWWNLDWSARVAFNFDTTPQGADVTEDIADFPVLLRLHSGNFPGFFLVAEQARDLRLMAADDKTPLKFHVEQFDAINELAFVWVRVPHLDANSNLQQVYLYYGNGTAVTAANPGETFDSSQGLVLHFGADDALPQDASAYSNHPIRFTGLANPAALIGAGANFDGESELAVAEAPSIRLLPEQGWTWSAWVKPAELVDDAVLMHMGSELGWIDLRVSDGALRAAWLGADGEVFSTEGVPLTVDQWQQVAVVVESDRIGLHVNGERLSEVQVSISELGGELLIGGGLSGLPGFIGTMDEVRVAQTARSLSWLRLAYKAEGGDTLVRAGPEESAGEETSDSGRGSYFGTILSNVSVDGWVVMGILGIMSVLSWVIMILKSLALNRIQKDNRQFLAEFRQLDAAHPGALDRDEDRTDTDADEAPVINALFGEHDHFQSSNLYRIYHKGVHELESRLGRSVGAQAAGLTSRSVNAIRAGLDASTVREVQKLNSLMVLLTIAISGGPFLGLLGTVMGVMITFAAIAATGDVNIDAIAPGVSAALMTTVAGLFVAIPALFGYNFLATRIRDMTAEMYVFVDELEARIAEFHG